MFDIKQYRRKEVERQRVESILGLLPAGVQTVLEAGCRDGYITHLLADRYPEVTALDLQLPVIEHPRVTCVQGDITRLQFASRSFDLVVCTQVLEHIPAEKLEDACAELLRVTKRYLLIGVPYKQDLRVHAMRCVQCGTLNPTTGHLHSFDRERLLALFGDRPFSRIDYAGEGVYKTNRFSYALYKRFGFPYGSYEQEEPCICCGAALEKPRLPLFLRLVCLFAKGLEFVQNKTGPDKSPVWIHMLWDFKEQET
ncbi:MAG: class I SAM-dependent methyltransferase [Bacteroidales bacterium]|mgnify:CR=1 FL=1|nr:class I SAM-dependent methyltransferase [Bacteroidales bacterium]NLK80071.1 class I SAM-dependent methyltransferase [Bacteroidales bacterium]HKM31029.1 class I SAM-dependent methyltransferase [Bacteroidales bacterium]